MCSINKIGSPGDKTSSDARSHSAQGLFSGVTNSTMKIPLPPRLWITDVSDNSSDELDGHLKEEPGAMERVRVRSRFRHHKQKTVNIPIGIFWDIENCQVPRGCSAIDVVAAIRSKFLNSRREADFVVVCDVRKESPIRLQELNDAQVNLIHVCGTQKNAADEKLRQCMRRFGELHSAPAALLLVSGDINFAADLSDFRHRKNMEVILVHNKNTSSALITCASSHYCYNELTANLPRNSKTLSLNEDEEDPTCELEVGNLPMDQPPDKVSKRLKRLADNCGGKVLNVTASTALLRFPTLDQAGRALKRMEGEDVFGRKISTRYRRSAPPAAPTYSSDEGYSTAPPATHPAPHTSHQPPAYTQQLPVACSEAKPYVSNMSREWALALQQLPAPAPPPLEYCPPPAAKPRQIRGAHGSANLDRSGCSSSNSFEDIRQRDNSQSRAISPWNSSASFSEQSDGDIEATTELTVSNLPPQEHATLQDMLVKLFSQHVPVVRVVVWTSGEGPLGTVVLRSEWDARLAIARIHKRRLENKWMGRRLELSLGRPSPAPGLDVLRARLRTILLDQKGYTLPLLRLRDSYASRYCCALTTSDLMKIGDTVVIHEGFGRLVQLVDLTPVSSAEVEEAPWKCHIHASLGACLEDGTRILQPVYMEISTLAMNTKKLIDNHGGMIPLLTFVECYEGVFGPLPADARRGVALELLLRAAPGLALRDEPSRHLLRTRPAADVADTNARAPSESSRWSAEAGRTAPALEPMLALFERELVELLKSAPRCTIPFSKLIPAFHHYFGRQCRVADYGFTKLPDLLAVLSNTIVVLGSGSSRVITISAAAQSRRWTSDLVKLINAQPGRTIMPQEIPQMYEATFGQPFSPVNYGVCTMGELMQRVSPTAVVVAADGGVSLPRPTPTAEERSRTALFAAHAVELLCHTPNLRMEFSQFVPEYHAHFDRQLRVAHYGCVKLVELFETIPEAVSVHCESNGERSVRLSRRTARAVFGQRLRALGPLTLAEFPLRYARRYGAAPLPDMLGAETPAGLVLAAGGSVQGGVVAAPGAAPRWVSAELAACAALCADRSVAARGSTLEYLAAAVRRAGGAEPAVGELAAAGVLLLVDRHVRLTPSWRAVWRLAQILAESPLLTAVDLYVEYTRRYEPTFPCADLGFESLVEFLRYYHEVFVEEGACWTLCEGVVVPHSNELTPVQENYAIHDTPPGHKGSSVFESPKTNIWCSPPASALPTPSALLTLEKRRVRLAAQFDAI